MSRSADELLRDALIHLRLAEQYAGHDELEQLTIDAVCMRLSAGIEVLAGLAPQVRDRLFGNDWHFMWGMRNRIAHGYLLIDSEIVRKTIEADVPGMIRVITRELGGPVEGAGDNSPAPTSRDRPDRE